ncbi:MAG TPA: SRPBCC domain-containing protein [Pseudonocardia sp.]|nr:SRPBCC domain-containing protein [Pseudonocardia sp.]
MPSEFEIRTEIEIEADPEQIWQAIATGPGITSWFMPHDVTPGVGGTVALTVAGFESEATIIDWEPPKRLAYRAPAAEDGTVHAMEFLIEGRDGATTVVRFAHNGFSGDDWGDEYEANLGDGWTFYLHTLREYVLHFAGRPVTFISANAPATSMGRDNWPALRAGLGLGLDGPIEVGRSVRLTPAGLPPLAGVVDYANEAFLGLRTDDGLYRFHGVSGLGMPVAVGHHVYRDDVDRDALERDWNGWLAATFTG